MIIFVKYDSSKINKNLIILVEDDGPGIPQEEIENLFKPDN